ADFWAGPRSCTLESKLKQLCCLCRRLEDLTKGLAQTKRRVRRVIEIVVVENHMQFTCFLRQLPAALCDLRDFALAVIVIETRGHSYASDVGLCIASMQTEGCNLRVRDLSVFPWHDREMIRRRRVHLHKNCTILLQKIDRRLQLVADCPIAISKLNRKIVIAQHFDQLNKLV